MSYMNYALGKKGPLSRVWLAANWEKTLTRAHVFETNIENTVEGILRPDLKMELRTTGHLLLGVTKIYHRKAKYLLADCNEACLKLKMAFRSDMVDQMEMNLEGAAAENTVPGVFHEFDTTMPEINDVDMNDQFSLNQSRVEDITMREDYESFLPAANDDEFGDMSMDEEEFDLIQLPKTSTEQEEPTNADHVNGTEVPRPAHIQENSQSVAFSSSGGSGGSLFDDVAVSEPSLTMASIKLAEAFNPHAEVLTSDSIDSTPHFGIESSSYTGRIREDDARAKPSEMILAATHAPSPTKTTVLNTEEESFVLASAVASQPHGFRKSEHKRKLIVDEKKNISVEEMRQIMRNTSDIVMELDLAPPTKRIMHCVDTQLVEKLFVLPARPIPARALLYSYQRHVTSHAFVAKNARDILARASMEPKFNLPREIDTHNYVQKLIAPASPPVDSSVLSVVTSPPEKIHTPTLSVATEQTMMVNMGYVEPEKPDEQELINMGYDPSAEMETPSYDDYEIQASIETGVKLAQLQQVVDETDELFENRVLHQRVQKLFTKIHSHLLRSERLHWSDMACRSTRKEAAQNFYSLLMLRKYKVLELSQPEPYEAIVITPGSLFGFPFM